MVAAPISYIGIVIALLLVVAIAAVVLVLINKLAREPEKPVKKQHALPAKVDEKDNHQQEI